MNLNEFLKIEVSIARPVKLERYIVFIKIKYHLFYLSLLCKHYFSHVIFHRGVIFSKTKENEIKETLIYKMIL